MVDGKKNDLSGKRIAWVMPVLEAGSGGLQTICRHITYLQSQGAVCDFISCQFEYADSEAGTRKILREYYQCEPDALYMNGHSPEHYDVAVATLNLTVPLARSVDADHRVYFVQDYEPYFYAMGDHYLSARGTYAAGFSIVTIGRWLSHKLYDELGAKTWYTDFAADEGIYHPLGIERQQKVCAIFQPDKDRRCPNLILDALEIVHAIEPDVEIVLYGADGVYDFPIPVTFRGLVSKEECNRIYNECSVGLCVSSTNPSRIPFEMMAAGLPVVDVYRENTCWDFDPRCSLLADPTPAGLAQTILSVVKDPDRVKSLGEAGVEFMKPRAAGSEQKAFAQALVEAMAQKTPPEPQAISPALVKTAPPAASDEVKAVQDVFQSRRLKTKIVPPGVDCSLSYAKLTIEGLPCDGSHVGVNAIVIPSMAKNRARRFDAYGMDAEGRVLLQIDFNRLEGRSDLYSVRIYLDRGGESVYLTECSIRYWSSGEKHTEPAGPLVYHDPLSSAERVVSFEFSATPFANIATSAAFALLPAPLLDAVRPIAKTVLGR